MAVRGGHIGKGRAAFTQSQRGAAFQSVQQIWPKTEALSSSPITWSVRVTWPSVLPDDQSHDLWPKRLCFIRIFPISEWIFSTNCLHRKKNASNCKFRSLLVVIINSKYDHKKWSKRTVTSVLFSMYLFQKVFINNKLFIYVI